MSSGVFSYIPGRKFTVLDEFIFQATDNHGLESTNTGLVTINIKSTQEPTPNNEQPPLLLLSSVCTDSDNSKKKPKGTQCNDELVGTLQRDVVTGLGGNYRFNGCSGNDALNDNSGNDGIAGGPGDDNIHGNEGNNILVGKEGRDKFSCGS